MGETTGIAWTDATVNFWWGCTKVGPGCDHCYAETWSKRTGGQHWGSGVPRRRIAGAIAMIRKLDARAAKDGAKRRVFIQSMSDLFDNEVPLEWFVEAWCEIEANYRLEIQVVTKRISIVEKRLAAIGRTAWPKHAGLLVTVCNQEEAERDVPRLLALKMKLGIPWVGLSVEPLLGSMRLHELSGGRPDAVIDALRGEIWTWGAEGVRYDLQRGQPRLDWIICGGESGPGARPMHPAWVHSIRGQCAAAGVPFFFKQFGEWSPDPLGTNCETCVVLPDATILRGANVLDRPDEQNGEIMWRVGKARAGRLLDGRTHEEFPRSA